jgi:hypothetical protein
MKRTYSFLISSFLLAAFVYIAGLSSCVKREFDEPPYADETSELTPNTTLAQLKALYKGTAIQIKDDLIVSAVVVADDRSGNYFKSIIVQDQTAGIDIQIDKIALHDDYPIGREIFIKCKDLWIGNNNGSLQLGASVDGTGRAQRIPDNLRSKFLYRGRRNQAITPLVIKINELNETHIHRLVRLEGVQFKSSDVDKTLANAATQTSVNLNLEDCSMNGIILRTSGFSSFASAKASASKGAVTAIYSVFGTDKQLFLRELEDINFTESRCGSGGGDLNLVSIASVRALFTGQTTAAPAKSKIKASVITDRTNSNITSRNIVVQEPNGAGIVIRFAASNTFALGDQIEVDISGMEISEFNGLLQLNNIPNSNAVKVGEGNMPSPIELTISEILASFENYESRLVRVKDVQVTKSGSDNYSGTCTLSDGTGSMDLFTQSYAAFADATIPNSKVNITAVVSQGGTQQSKQLFIRNLTDVSGSGGGGGSDLNETFTGVGSNVDLNLAGWSNIAEIGSRLWRGQVFNGNGYAQATSFNSSDPVNVMWLVSPPITLDVPKILTFETAMNFWRHNGLEVFISNDFNGNNVSTATWTKINARLAEETDPVNTFIPSGEIDLSAFSGTVRIAFKYSGDNSNNTSTYRVDNVKVVLK